MGRDDTSTDEAQSVPSRHAPQPGVVLIVLAAKPTLKIVTWEQKPIVVGRGEGSTFVLEDKRLSRAHAAISRDTHGWSVRDLDSRNGTKVDGRQLGSSEIGRGSVVRIGDSLLLLEDDVSHFGQPHALFDPQRVVGPRLQQAIDRARRGAQNGLNVLLLGESGVGKELIARAYHEASPFPNGPFRALNCAALPDGVLEDELFGHVRGAFSGATADRAGLLESAHKGTLFLDEIGDMPMQVQAKLLRALENGEVRRIGENEPRHIRVQVVSATNHRLRERVAQGMFRHDLFNRIGLSAVDVPPLRARREEIPFLVALALHQTGDPLAEGSLYEQCLLRYWPGNVRELLGAVRDAAANVPPGTALRGKNLAPQAGTLGAWVTTPPPSPIAGAPSVPSAPSDGPVGMNREQRIAAAVDYAKQGMAVAEIAKRVGVSAPSVYRWLKDLGLRD